MPDRDSDDRPAADRASTRALIMAPIPIVWAFIGGSAAMLLHVQTDYVLFAAGLVLVAAVLTQWMQRHPVVR